MLKVDASNNFCFYIGIPYCFSVCTYCHYIPNLFFGESSVPNSYVECLCRQLRTFIETNKFFNRTLKSCYWGGGTPSLLSVAQMSKIIDVFNSYKINFEEKSIEVHPKYWSNDLLDLNFFNRFSIGIQTTDVFKLSRWKRPVDTRQRVLLILEEIRSAASEAVINFDFLIETTIFKQDVEFLNQSRPDSVVFYPQTGERTEKEAAATFFSLEYLVGLLTEYKRSTPAGFHFYKNYQKISLYARSQYSHSADIVGFGHNSISYIGNRSFLSRFSDSFKEWTMIDRNRNVIQDLFWESSLFGIPNKIKQKIRFEGEYLFHHNKYLDISYLPIDRNTWKKFFSVAEKQFGTEIKPVLFSAFFWSDNGEKDFDVFFDELDRLRVSFCNALPSFQRKSLPIPSCHILIEGIDGSGKDTFASFLVEFLTLFSNQISGTSISIVGLPSSRTVYGNECKEFIETGEKKFSYKHMAHMLKNNRIEFLTYLNKHYPGLKIYIRGILTEQATLCRLYPSQAHPMRSLNDIDLYIWVNTNPYIARTRILLRGEKETWRESMDNLLFFDDFFKLGTRYFSSYIEVDNSSDSLSYLKMQAYQVAKHIYFKFYQQPCGVNQS